MSDVSREAVERVQAAVPACLGAKVAELAEGAGRRSVAPRSGGIVDHQTTVTMDDIDGGQARFERVLQETTPEALAERKEQIAGLTLQEALDGQTRGGPRVAGYRDTPMAREYWRSREQPPPDDEPEDEDDPNTGLPMEQVH